MAAEERDCSYSWLRRAASGAPPSIVSGCIAKVPGRTNTVSYKAHATSSGCYCRGAGVVLADASNFNKKPSHHLHSVGGWWFNHGKCLQVWDSRQVLRSRASSISRSGLMPTELTQESHLLPTRWPVTINYGHYEDEDEDWWLLHEGEEDQCLVCLKGEQSILIVLPTSVPSLEKLVPSIPAHDYGGNRCSETLCLVGIRLVYCDGWCSLTRYNIVDYGIEISGIHFQYQNKAQYLQ